MSESHALAIQLRAGVHFAEVERREDGDLGGLGVHVAARVAELASADEILISRTVADVTAGGGFTLEDRGSHALKGIATRWDVYAVTP